ncbi:hypothetical protein [Escherichia coli]|uniref:hypothetical protein n=1 Tax=Escherichia coli TaxID=562 RepID=UPI001314AC84
MASTEEKLLTLLLSVEHLQHTAIEQQKAVADSLLSCAYLRVLRSFEVPVMLPTY